MFGKGRSASRHEQQPNSHLECSRAADVTEPRSPPFRPRAAVRYLFGFEGLTAVGAEQKAFKGGSPPISFRIHEVRTGSPDGARSDFEQMVVQLVAATMPGVRSVKANPGDWGIDAFLGSLADGSMITVWQSKYFIDGVGKVQQDQIRKSFTSACDSAKKHSYVLGSWVLCIPDSMDGPTTKWWDTWRKSQAKSGVIIDLWDHTTLIQRLISPEGSDVRRAFYEPQGSGLVPLASASTVAAVPIDADLDSALFIQQLRAAGHTEFDAAKREFFNAELVAREILDKGIPQEVGLLMAADASVHSLWEHRYNSACAGHDADHLPDLHSGVMVDVRAERHTLLPGITDNIVHACGLVHRVVEDGRAGWTRHWRPIAHAYPRLRSIAQADEAEHDGDACEASS